MKELKTIGEIMQDYIEKFVEPTIPGTYGAVQVDHIRLWLSKTLSSHTEQLIEELEGMKRTYPHPHCDCPECISTNGQISALSQAQELLKKTIA